MSAHRTSVGDAPIHAAGDAFRAQRKRAARARRRIVAVGCFTALMLGSAFLPPIPRLVWNASASAPLGLYGVAPYADIRPGDMVIARLPEPWRMFAASRRYLPSNVPLVKRVAAGPGARVCGSEDRLTVDGRLQVRRLHHDRAGRTMPWWQGCLTLGEGHYLLLVTDSPASFDGRYFGITKRTEIIGRATLLWSAD